MRNFATQYAKLLTFSDAARALGLENDPRVLQIMQFVQKQVLTEALNSACHRGILASYRSADRGLLQAKQEEVRGSHSAAHHHPAQPRHRREAQTIRGRRKGLCRPDPEALGRWRRSGEAGERSDRPRWLDNSSGQCQSRSTPSGHVARSARVSLRAEAGRVSLSCSPTLPPFTFTKSFLCAKSRSAKPRPEITHNAAASIGD